MASFPGLASHCLLIAGSRLPLLQRRQGVELLSWVSGEGRVNRVSSLPLCHHGGSKHQGKMSCEAKRGGVR